MKTRRVDRYFHDFVTTDSTFNDLRRTEECIRTIVVIDERRIYTVNIQFTWNEAKRLSNVADHGFDFMDVPAVFSGWTMTFEDDRFDYGEQRFVTLGFLKKMAVSVVHTETDSRIHVISFRKATRRESRLLHENI